VKLPAGDVVVCADGIVLREWTAADVGAMVTLFDEESIDVWTPLESPFDAAAAQRYLERAYRLRAAGRGIQLAITTDSPEPLGEVLLFDGDSPDTAELAYAVGVAHRGLGLAARAVRIMMEFAAEQCGVSSFLLTISPANLASQAVARAAGFHQTGEPVKVRERKGRRLEMTTWRCELSAHLQPPAGIPSGAAPV
jgi:RimJ/RimL family protein N-acetyltransferase